MERGLLKRGTHSKMQALDYSCCSFAQELSNGHIFRENSNLVLQLLVSFSTVIGYSNKLPTSVTLTKAASLGKLEIF